MSHFIIELWISVSRVAYSREWDFENLFETLGFSPWGICEKPACVMIAIIIKHLHSWYKTTRSLLRFPPPALLSLPLTVI